MRRILASLAFALGMAAAPAAFAAGAAKHPMHLEWEFEGPFGQFDQAALQRGWQVYKEVCSSCHGMSMLSYRNLGEKGGPFATYEVRNEETGQVELVIGPHGHGGKLVNPIDSPAIKAIAAEFNVTELDNNTGDEVTRPARPADRFVKPFPNEAIARLANGGAYPPDLSVITKARHGGANYLYSLLVGYEEPDAAHAAEAPPGKYYNPYFPGGWIAMPPPLVPDRVTYADGTAATVEQMAKDVSVFLEWAGDPKAMQRKQMGFSVMVYLLILSGLLFLAYKQIWRNVKH